MRMRCHIAGYEWCGCTDEPYLLQGITTRWTTCSSSIFTSIATGEGELRAGCWIGELDVMWWCSMFNTTRSARHAHAQETQRRNAGHTQQRTATQHTDYLQHAWCRVWGHNYIHIIILSHPFTIQYQFPSSISISISLLLFCIIHFPIIVYQFVPTYFPAPSAPLLRVHEWLNTFGHNGISTLHPLHTIMIYAFSSQPQNNHVLTCSLPPQLLLVDLYFNKPVDHLPQPTSNTSLRDLLQPNNTPSALFSHWDLLLGSSLNQPVDPSSLISLFFLWDDQSIICPVSSLTYVHLTRSINPSTTYLPFFLPPSLPPSPIFSSDPQTSDIPWTISLPLLSSSATTQHSSVLPSSIHPSLPLFPLSLPRVHLPDGLDGLSVSAKNKASQRWSTIVNNSQQKSTMVNSGR